MIKILFLEDNKLFNDTLCNFLGKKGYQIQTLLDPCSVLELTYTTRFDLYLFAVNFPYTSGFDLLQELRESGDKTPAIFLTSHTNKASIIKGFSVGADDYMIKPIDLDELLLRIQAILRRQIRSNKIELGRYTLDCNAKRLYCGKELIRDVTTKAIELLLLLIMAKGEVVRTEHIEHHLWHVNEEVSTSSLRVYIAILKKYFPNQIKNIRGVGYRFIGSFS
ncbi:DNA-binding response regulator [hydrothermal vent metagenome]|uniref:DNA-binding response regulator n=1 Tax=hydrothermal vent metagenome TaxID=652676 RepID=A0A1W1CU32_9ZZZZ